MSSHSRPTSSSSPARSPLPEPPSYSSSSSSTSVRAIQTIAPQVEEVRGDDVGNASDRSSSSERLRPHEGPAWVDPKVYGIASMFHTDASVADFLNKVLVLKASAKESLLSFGPCSLDDRVYREWLSTEPPFFFMYNCLFSDLHVSLPFYKFTVGILQALNVAPS